jgi:hypothetical protein
MCWIFFQKIAELQVASIMFDLQILNFILLVRPVLTANTLFLLLKLLYVPCVLVRDHLGNSEMEK